MSVSALQERLLRMGRREVAAGSPDLAGLDHVEARQTDEEHWELTLYFVPPSGRGAAVPAGIGPGNLRITRQDGGALPGVWVKAVEVRQDGDETLLATVAVTDRALAARLAGDPGPYALEIVDVARMDRYLSRSLFYWTGRDTAVVPVLPAERPNLPALADIDYLAKDFHSFRKLMLDRMALALPQWQERNPVDLGVAVVEVLAYAADHLSYYQDAVATEAYLETARQRTSVRRHVRLLDYSLHEGCNARVWLEMHVDPGRSDEVLLPAGTEVLTGDRRPGAIPEESEAYREALAAGAQVFETLHDATLRSEHNVFQLHAWRLADYRLPPGATRAALVGHHRRLQRGDVLVLRQVRSPQTGAKDDADPRQAHAVRLAVPSRLDWDGSVEITEIAWHEEDALPFPLWVSREAEGWSRSDLAEVYGNVVLADHGRTVVEELPAVPARERYAPVLSQRHLVFSAPSDATEAESLPAVAAVFQNPVRALPALVLYEVSEGYFYRHAEAPAPEAAPESPALASARALGLEAVLESIPEEKEEPAPPPFLRRSRFDRAFHKALGLPPHEMPQSDVWTARKDLLWSGRFARDFVVEPEADGHARLRFGDGFQGLSPAPGSRLWAVYRVGNPVRGNVGPGMITQLVGDGFGVAGAHNCVPARGGTLPEDVETARRNAPQAFHSQRRCVTEGDYVALTERVPGVLRAQCVKSWNGSGVTALVAVQRSAGLPADEEFLGRLNAYLQPFLVVGHELEVRPPDLVPLHIVLDVEVAPGHLRNPIRDDLLRVLGDRNLPDGRVGFFHPDRFTFGEPVYASDLIAAAMSVHGVANVQVVELRRLGRPQGGEIEAGRIEMDRLEIAQCRNTPGAPRQGVLELRLRGGQ
ncbi:MAG TPA: baseplate J/gp47 family protein [Thermoanaerobaculia bacterium]|nr:baseplate J/gp47 family protein [Thermoanaerobaculia bacterium]